MANNKFYQELADYLKSHDTDNANKVVMAELGNILVKERENFIALLRYSDLAVSDTANDAELIEQFVNSAHNNRKLLIGAALLVNQHNKQVGFDGEEEISDAGVKAVHKVMYNHFDAAYFDADDYSNVGGAWAGAIDSIAKLGSNVGGGIVQNQRAKKSGTVDLLNKREDAKNAMVQSVLEQRKAQAETLQKQAEQKAKTNKVIIISVVSVLSLALIVGTVIVLKKKQ
jgi:hypothetical protein